MHRCFSKFFLEGEIRQVAIYMFRFSVLDNMVPGAAAYRSEPRSLRGHPLWILEKYSYLCQIDQIYKDLDL